MFEGIFQPMHLLVILFIASRCWCSGRRSCRSLAKG